MPLLQPLVVPRTKVSHSNPILFDNGSGVQEFFPPGQKLFGREVIPPSNKWKDGTLSFMAPMAHYHLLQTESFHVESGSGHWIFPVQNNKRVLLKAGGDITIPKFVSHRFENASSTEPLVIAYRYDAQMYLMERRFFANALTYLDDSRKANVEPSLLQICVMLSEAWMPPDVIPVPPILGEYLRCLVNSIFMWILAGIGRTLYGYKGSYEEYYDENLFANEMEGKKGL